MQKQAVALAMAKCGRIEKWFTQDDGAASAASASGGGAIRLVFEFTQIDDLSTVAQLSGMKFGEFDISCRIADETAKTNAQFVSALPLAITAGPAGAALAAAAAARASANDDDNQPEHIRAMRAMLRELAADSSAQQAMRRPGDEVNEELVSDEGRLAAFVGEHAERQARALIVLTKRYVAEKRAELQQLTGGAVDEDDAAATGVSDQSSSTKAPAAAANRGASKSSTSSSSSSSSSRSSKKKKKKEKKRDHDKKKKSKKSKSKKEKK
jgi:hypothetical protein